MVMGFSKGPRRDTPERNAMSQTTTALLEALALCKEQLPRNTHPIWTARLQVIERLITRAVEREPDLWADTLARAERIADQILAQRQRG
jgi:hypothetical protein